MLANLALRTLPVRIGLSSLPTRVGAWDSFRIVSTGLGAFLCRAFTIVALTACAASGADRVEGLDANAQIVPSRRSLPVLGGGYDRRLGSSTNIPFSRDTAERALRVRDATRTMDPAEVPLYRLKRPTLNRWFWFNQNTHNQNVHNMEYSPQRDVVWDHGPWSRHGQNRFNQGLHNVSRFNQSTFNQNRFNLSAHNVTPPVAQLR